MSRLLSWSSQVHFISLMNEIIVENGCWSCGEVDSMCCVSPESAYLVLKWLQRSCSHTLYNLRLQSAVLLYTSVLTRRPYLIPLHTVCIALNLLCFSSQYSSHGNYSIFFLVSLFLECSDFECNDSYLLYF